MGSYHAVAVWVGLSPECGCCRAVTTVYENPVENEHIEQSKREFLKGGLSVVYASWDDYLTKYSPSMSNPCGRHSDHRRADADEARTKQETASTPVAHSAPK